MRVINTKQSPVRLMGKAKSEVRAQFGALCWRIHKDKVQVLLVQTRRRKRWIAPKGWPMEGMTPAKAAAREAFEEAGVEGKISPVCVGVYSYTKYPRSGADPIPCMVSLFPLLVTNTLKEYPEKGQRKRKWMSLKKAAKRTDEPELARILKNFDPLQRKD